MRKSLFALAPAALLLMSAATTSVAATNGELTVTGNVTSATCDVKMSHTALNLGNWTPADFGSTAKAPVVGSAKTFTVGLENCSNPTVKDLAANLIATGATLPFHDDMFNSDDSGNTGVILRKSGDTTNISANTAIQLKQFVATDDEADATKLNALSQDFTVALASTAATGITPGMLTAPIVFQFDYN